jgi:hypothetical protein
MRAKFGIVGLCVAAIALASFGALPVDAAQNQKKKTAATKKAVAKAPPRTRIIVQRRSFLDAGTDVNPGERKFTDYAVPPGYTPYGVIDNRAGSWRSPLPGPYDLPSRQNPWPWHWCVGC